MSIEALLHNAREVKCQIPLGDISINIHERLPVQAFATSQISCPRCKKNQFALFKEKYRYICFCLDDKCLRLDSLASNSKAREDGSKDPERNKRGMVMSGAEKFGLGSAYKDAELPRWIASTHQRDRIFSWMKNEKPFLLVCGAPGCGKTYLSAAILNYLFHGKEEVSYTTHRRFIEEIHLAIQSDRTQHSVVNLHGAKKFLIIDDLGAATCTEWQKEMILELIDQRYSDKSKTVITTNFNKDEIKSKLGERTSSRLFDSNNELMEFWKIADRRNDPERDEKQWFNIED